MAELIYSVNQVFGSYLNVGQQYNIPEYQRGYKWSAQQIEQLLNDINDFETDGDEDLFYCLQNITLVSQKDTKEKINVVDGQQRLTTIALLLTYLGVYEKVEGKLIYAVRETSNNFIQLLITESEFLESVLESTDFQNFVEEKGSDFDFQDIFFMYNAIKTFQHWFTMNPNVNKESFKSKILNNVKLIINRIENISEQELFMNLNTGKVPLDGADLIRAILITRVAKQEMELYDPKNIKDVVRLNERRIRIGWELDEINQWWNQENVKEFFLPFVKIFTDAEETISFDFNINAINLLYSLWLQSLKKEYSDVENKYKSVKLKYFETKKISALKLYHDILSLHRTLVDWYDDRTIYHYLGYLASNSPTFNFRSIVNFWNNKSNTRDQFKNELKRLVTVTAFGVEGKPKQGFEYWKGKILDYNTGEKTNWYDSKQLEKTLVLLDIIDLSENEYLPFLKSTHFKKNDEDKEHIYPATPKSIKELKNNDAHGLINSYLRKLNLTELTETEEEWMELDEYEKEEILNNLSKKIHEETNINSIGNLVLLHYSINRGFGNDYYIDKRASVIKNTQLGKYVRQHTLKVFTKQLNSSEDLNDWTMNDIANNANKIALSLEAFVQKKHEQV
ncbi:DUF262 domain-containing protein [Flavobacterium sp. CYK-55]|uniref:DUF262 domain-containing protein n=1 Tax=Flavobacterium sp. CYK-55 TaxID=2835529 RepID=UPI001BD05CE3|nr:DUF262 domain-containing protein [Flavobacterium sp. CYK-55]MBS7786616.1 DUF262 domain-containing protein [Flavobacterium sp. CYK-55]